MNGKVAGAVLLMAMTTSTATTLQERTQPEQASDLKSTAGSTTHPAQPPLQRQQTWYEFMLRQFNPSDYDYGRWMERKRRELIETRIKNPYFLYSLSTTLALFITAAICTKKQIDHRRTMWITAEIMADVYNQDAYSRQVAQDAIERYNKHIDRCNRAIEAGDNAVAASAATNEVEQLRTELMRVAEERDNVTRERDIAREDLRKKSEILAEMSVRLEALATRSGATNAGKSASDLRGADGKLIAHINDLQEQLYRERNNNRRLRGG